MASETPNKFGGFQLEWIGPQPSLVHSNWKELALNLVGDLFFTRTPSSMMDVTKLQTFGWTLWSSNYVKYEYIIIFSLTQDDVNNKDSNP